MEEGQDWPKFVAMIIIVNMMMPLHARAGYLGRK